MESAGDPSVSVEQPLPPATVVGDASRWRRRSRLLVHLGLLATALAALGTLQLLHVRNAIHSVIGLTFAAFVLVHLIQRRRTISRWAIQVIGNRLRPGAARLLSSDLLLAFIAVNVVLSGILDWNRGQPMSLPLPRHFGRWHLLASVVLVIYLVVHVLRRRKRLRRSVIQ